MPLYQKLRPSKIENNRLKITPSFYNEKTSELLKLSELPSIRLFAHPCIRGKIAELTKSAQKEIKSKCNHKEPHRHELHISVNDRFTKRFVDLMISSDALREYTKFAQVRLVDNLESDLTINMPLKLSMSNTGKENIQLRNGDDLTLFHSHISYD